MANGNEEEQSWLRLQGQPITLSHQDHVRNVLMSTKRSVRSAPLVNNHILYRNLLTPIQSKRIQPNARPSSVLPTEQLPNTSGIDQYTSTSTHFSEVCKSSKEKANKDSEALKTLVIRIPSSHSTYS